MKFTSVDQIAYPMGRQKWRLVLVDDRRDLTGRKLVWMQGTSYRDPVTKLTAYTEAHLTLSDGISTQTIGGWRLTPLLISNLKIEINTVFGEGVAEQIDIGKTLIIEKDD